MHGAQTQLLLGDYVRDCSNGAVFETGVFNRTGCLGYGFRREWHGLVYTLTSFIIITIVKAGRLRRSWAPCALGSVHMHTFAPYKTNLVLSYITGSRFTTFFLRPSISFAGSFLME